MVLCIAFLPLAGAGRRRRPFGPGESCRFGSTSSSRTPFARGRLVGAVGVRSLLGKDKSMHGRLRCILAGSSAALVWAAQEPVDRRLFGCDYSDVAVLGKAVTRGRHWRTTGIAVHAMNGALFGLAYYEARRSLPIEGRRLAMAMALTEHALLYPLCFFIDRFHPARGQKACLRFSPTHVHSGRRRGATRSSA